MDKPMYDYESMCKEFELGLDDIEDGMGQLDMLLGQRRNMMDTINCLREACRSASSCLKLAVGGLEKGIDWEDLITGLDEVAPPWKESDPPQYEVDDSGAESEDKE